MERIIREGQKYHLVGKLNLNGKKFQLMNPEFEVENNTENVHTGRITPYYSLTQGIKQKFIRLKIKWLVDKIEYISDLQDYLPLEIKKSYNLTDLKNALRDIHFPESNENLKKAKHRIAFDELLNIQLRIAKQKQEFKRNKARIIKKEKSLNAIDKLEQKIPFELTKDQRKAINEVFDDLEKEKPMYRLLQGDVGSGKTIVAIFASLSCIENGYDVVVMTPTTILANQTFDTFKKIIDSDSLELITSSTKNIHKSLEKEEWKNGDKQNKGKIYVGTHALLYKEESLFSNLGLLIIDEQHRFGVEQRQKLQKLHPEKSPHYLIMTATPIPRTMMITLFGDIEYSIIKTKPKGRKDVLTYLVPETKKSDAYQWFNKKIKDKEQIFWVCPYIEDSENSNVKSVQQVYKELKTHINGKVEKLYGKLKEEEKNNIIQNFKDQKIDILLATTVIEVGIDIPNSNIIVIESAEQFGLAQLHQLRGRVGRAEKQGYCFLFSTNEIDEIVQERLKFFVSETNGLKISEFDLKRRGPGEVYGTKQSGIPKLRYASIYDTNLVENTRKAAHTILNFKNT